MKKNIIIGVSLIGCSIFAGAAETTESEKAEINTLASEPFLSSALERFSGSVSVGYESEYMFRGYNLCSGIVSPTVNLGYDLGAGFGVYAGYWAALSVDDLSETDPFNNTVDGHYCESDFSAGITYSIENFEIDVGYIAYVYDTGGNTNEIKAAVSYDTSELCGEDFALTPYAAGYYDLTLSAKTLEGGLSYSAPITKWLIGSNWGTLDIAGYAGYNYTPESHSFYTGFAFGGTASITEYCSVSAGMRYQYYNNEISDCGSKVWFGTSISVGF